MSPRKAAALRDGGRSLREHLIATAERLMAERGAAGLTVRAIAREAGVADGVLYNHFADKEELLACALRARVRAVESGLGDLPEPGAGTVEAGLRAFVAYGMALHAGILPVLAGLAGQPAVLARFAGGPVPGLDWRDRLLAYLNAERDLGRLAPDARVEAAARMIVGVCHEPVMSALASVSPPDPPAPAPAAPARGAAGPDDAGLDDLVAAVLHGLGRR
ncbi:TetR/AcrR family transcriptional regulator [Microbispora triticiradicis]|uniref:TetR/AcrR family transcriptional regulator n=1 Tax=Microbispora triticiradicis TaxID=2200763 RepID=A0ABX9LLJ8_9ACTN|nr:TetR/AcrR family transcriptional regulator [Microbispora triticiradicis]RGA03944.1 TetR/AcrR family transcriptional regulator [Microbispora triticiradicis]